MSDLNSLEPSEVERLGLIMAKVLKSAQQGGYIMLHSDAIVLDLNVEGIDTDDVELLTSLGLDLCTWCR